jgi:hypothetical protein
MNIRNATLSRLLANENITTITKNVRTAAFDPVTRTLILPTYSESVSNDFVEYMIGHEVGHAIFTDDPRVLETFQNGTAVQRGILNIIEDNRIERLIQSKYPGLITVFRRAQKELFEKNFFNTDGKDYTKFGFLDRINLKSKVGDYFRVFFDNDTENGIWDRVNAAMTSDEILEIYADILEYLKSQKEEEKEQSDESEADSDESDESEADSDESDESEADSDESDESEADSDESDESEADSDESDESDGITSDDDSDESDDAEPETAQNERADNSNLDEDNLDGFEPETVQSFGNELDKLIEDNEENNEYILNRKEMMNTVVRHTDWLEKHLNSLEGTTFVSNLRNLDSFICTTRSRVNHLVNEFNRRKAAWESIRATESKSGSIDTNRLHEYRTNEDIFLSRIDIANAKSHGMVFMIDRSASMTSSIRKVTEETLILAQFCQKVGIPFEVYGFTSTISAATTKPCLDDSGVYYNPLGEVHMIELLNSRTMSKSQMRNAMAAVLYGWSTTQCFTMGGTPLLQSLVALNEIHKDFRAATGVQKSTVMILTDGEGSNLHDINGALKIGNTYLPRGHKYNEKLTQIQEMIRESAPNTRVITYRLISNDNLYSHKRNCYGRWARQIMTFPEKVSDIVKSQSPNAKEVKAPAVLREKVVVYENVAGADLAYYQLLPDWKDKRATQRLAARNTEVSAEDLEGAKNKIAVNIVNKIVRENVAKAGDSRIEKFFVEILTQTIS